MSRRSAFTLIELLIIVAIIGAMLAGAVASVGAGMRSVHAKSATRRVLQLSRQARTMALLRQQPAVITYSEVWDGGEFRGSMIKVESKPEARNADHLPLQSLSGYETIDSGDDDGQEEDANSLRRSMEAIEDGSLEGIHVKVEMLDQDGRAFGEKKRSISVFSNVDYLLRTARESADAKKGAGNEQPKDDGGDANGVSADRNEPVSIVYETNGRCEPHRITVYKDGQDESTGLVMEVDRFGKVTVEDDK